MNKIKGGFFERERENLLEFPEGKKIDSVSIITFLELRPDCSTLRGGFHAPG